MQEVGVGYNVREGLERVPLALQRAQTSRAETWATGGGGKGGPEAAKRSRRGEAERPTQQTLLNV